MGKNISGTGMDTNIIGRMNIRGEAEPEYPRIKRIVVLDITPESHGNALGVGLADVLPKSLVDKINWQITYENVITSRFIERGFLPIVQPTEKAAIMTALETCGPITPETAKVIRIKDTLHLNEMYLSKAIWLELAKKNSINSLNEFQRLSFTESGFLLPF